MVSMTERIMAVLSRYGFLLENVDALVGDTSQTVKKIYKSLRARNPNIVYLRCFKNLP